MCLDSVKLDIQEIIQDENNSMEIKPRLVLHYPDGTLIYVYKCREGKSWLEFTPETSDPVDFWQSKNKDDYDPEEDDELDCVVVNIKNE